MHNPRAQTSKVIKINPKGSQARAMIANKQKGGKVPQKDNASNEETTCCQLWQAAKNGFLNVEEF